MSNRLHTSWRRTAIASITTLCFLQTTFLQTTAAQDPDYAILNSLGRFFGIGYTQGGYHAAADGRPNLVSGNHPSSSYGSQRLLYPYSLYYQPLRCSSPLPPARPPVDSLQQGKIEQNGSGLDAPDESGNSPSDRLLEEAEQLKLPAAEISFSILEPVFQPAQPSPLPYAQPTQTYTPNRYRPNSGAR